MSKTFTTAELDAMDGPRRLSGAELDALEQGDKTPLATRQAIAAQGRMSAPARFAMGVARPVLETAYGMKQLAGGELTPEQRHQLAVLRGNKGAAGTAGRVAGEIATFALPAGAGGKAVARFGPLLPRAVQRLAPAAVDVATTAGVEALKSPTADATRGEQALTGALGAGAGRAVGAMAAPFVRGVRPTPQAQALMDRGIPLTPGMVRNGGLQALENRLASIPGFAGAISNRQREAVNAWNRDLLQRVTPDATISAAGHEGFKDASAAFTEAYDKLWQRELPLDLSVLDGFWKNTVQRADVSLDPTSAATFGETLGRLMRGTLTPAAYAADDAILVSGPAISQVDDLLRKEAQNAGRRGEGQLAEQFGIARRQLKDLLPKDFVNEWNRIDGLYKEFTILRRAAGYKGAAAQEGIFTPDQLLSAAIAADKSAGKGATAKGLAALQSEATQARRVMGSNLPAERLGTAEKLSLPILGAAALLDPVTTTAVYGAGRAAYSPWMRDLLSGKYRTEADFLAEALRRRGVTTGTVGAALEE